MNTTSNTTTTKYFLTLFGSIHFNTAKYSHGQLGDAGPARPFHRDFTSPSHGDDHGMMAAAAGGNHYTNRLA